MKGRCLCGELEWNASGSRSWQCFCHCDDCKRQCGAPVVAFIGVDIAGFKWTGSPKTYVSSPGVTRSFCGNCGTPMAFQAERYEGESHVYAAHLDDPETFEPTCHVHNSERFDWLHLSDELKTFEGSADDA